MVLDGVLILKVMAPGLKTPVTGSIPGPDHVPPAGVPIKVAAESPEQYVGLLPEIETTGNESTVMIWKVSFVQPPEVKV